VFHPGARRARREVRPTRGGARAAGAAREEAAPRRISLLHVRGDPLRFLDLSEKVDVRRFACAIVLCDAAWADPDLDAANGIALRTKRDMLRLDALIMTVQLNIRRLLEARRPPPRSGAREGSACRRARRRGRPAALDAGQPLSDGAARTGRASAAPWQRSEQRRTCSTAGGGGRGASAGPRARAQGAGYPDINIITEKVAFEGVTRFEDRARLPLGISFNSTSLSASLLIQAAYDPLVRARAGPRPPAAPLARASPPLLKCIGSRRLFFFLSALAQRGELR